MKKLIVILFAVLFAVSSYAQNTDLSTNGRKTATDAWFDIVGDNNSSFLYKYGNVADTVSNNDSLWNYSFTIIKDWQDDCKYEARLKLDSISGSPAVTCALEGKYEWNDSWTSLTSATWGGTSSDTTINLSYSTAKNFRFVRVSLDATATAQKAKVNYLVVGLYD